MFSGFHGSAFAFCLLTWFWASWALLLLVGMLGVGMVWPLAATMIQTESSPEVRGRVMGILQCTPGFHLVGAFPLALAAGQLVGKLLLQELPASV